MSNRQESVSELFDRIVAAYTPADYGLAQFAEQTIPQKGLESPVILDLGCGAGAIVEWLALRSNGHIIGLDISLASLQGAQKRLRTGGLVNVSLVLADCMALPFRSGSIDFVFSKGMMSYVTDHYRAFRELEHVSGRHAQWILEFVRRTPLAKIVEYGRRCLVQLPLRFHHPVARGLAFVLYPVARLLIGRKANLQTDMTLENLIMDIFFSPVPLQSVCPNELCRYLAQLGWTMQKLDIPTSPVFSTATSFVVHVTRSDH